MSNKIYLYEKYHTTNTFFIKKINAIGADRRKGEGIVECLFVFFYKGSCICAVSIVIEICLQETWGFIGKGKVKGRRN